VPVELLCSKGIRLSGKTSNVSEGGMFVETALLLPVGSPVRCDLALVESSIEVFGRIAWSRRRQPLAAAGMGIQFVGFEDGARRVLSEVVAHGEAVPRLVVPEVTARIARPRGGRMIVAAVFAGVATTTAGMVMAILPTRSAAAEYPVARPAPVAAVRTPIAAAEEEAVAPAEPPAAAAVDIVPRRDGTTAIMLPIAGDVAVRHFPLADPDGVAVFFDSGRTTAELTSYRRSDGAVSRVWVGAEGREVRLFTRGAPPRYRVDRFERTLRVLFDAPATPVSR
jgi:Tfp pilus assembly protein PilZ